MFLFDAKPTKGNADQITDFKHGQGDRIALKKSRFNTLPEAGVLKKANFASNQQGAALEWDDCIIYNTKTGALLYDKDGNGAAEAVELAVLKGKPKLIARDIFVVK